MTSLASTTEVAYPAEVSRARHMTVVSAKVRSAQMDGGAARFVDCIMGSSTAAVLHGKQKGGRLLWVAHERP